MLDQHVEDGAEISKPAQTSTEPKKKEVGPLGQRTLFLRLPRHDFGSYKPEQIRREIEKSLAPIKLVDFEPAVKKRWDPHHVKRVARGGYSGYCFLEFEDNFSALRGIEILCKNGLLGKKIDPKFCTKKREDERAQEKMIMKMQRSRRSVMMPHQIERERMKRSRAEMEWRNVRSEFWGRRPRAPMRRGSREHMILDSDAGRQVKHADLSGCPWLQSPWGSAAGRRSSSSPRDGPKLGQPSVPLQPPAKRQRLNTAIKTDDGPGGDKGKMDDDAPPPWQQSESRRWFAERTSRGGPGAFAERTSRGGRPRGRWVFHPEPAEEETFYGPHDFASFPRSMRRPYWSRSSRSGIRNFPGNPPPKRNSSDRGFRSIFTG